MAVKRIQTPDTDLNRVQDNLREPLNALLSIPILDGRLVEDVVLTGNTLVEHKLGRKPLGYLVVKTSEATKDVGTFPAIAPPINPDETKFLSLVPTTNGTYTLWVF